MVLLIPFALAHDCALSSDFTIVTASEQGCDNLVLFLANAADIWGNFTGGTPPPDIEDCIDITSTTASFCNQNPCPLANDGGVIDDTVFWDTHVNVSYPINLTALGFLADSVSSGTVNLSICADLDEDFVCDGGADIFNRSCMINSSFVINGHYNCNIAEFPADAGAYIIRAKSDTGNGLAFATNGSFTASYYNETTGQPFGSAWTGLIVDASGGRNYYYVYGNVTSDSSPCISIESVNNVTFDCQNYLLSGNTSVNDYFMNIYNSTNISVVNCSFLNAHAYINASSAEFLGDFGNGNVSDSGCFMPFGMFVGGDYLICPIDWYSSNSTFSAGDNSVLHGNGVKLHGILFNESVGFAVYGNNVSIDAVSFDNYYTGILVGGSGYFLPSNFNVTIDNALVYDNIVGLRAAFQENLYIKNSNISGNQQGGILSFLAANVTINNSLVNDNGYGNISVDWLGMGVAPAFGSYFLIMTGNVYNSHFDGNFNDGLFYVGFNLDIRNNSFSDNSGLGIGALGVTGLGYQNIMNISSNIVSSNLLSGVFLAGNNLTLGKNLIINNGDGVSMPDISTLYFIYLVFNQIYLVNITQDPYLTAIIPNILYNGVSSVFGTPGQVDVYSKNNISGNYDMGIFAYFSAADTYAYNNTLCGNGRGVNPQVLYLSNLFADGTQSPYYNNYCQNDSATGWTSADRILDITASPIDSAVNIEEYASNEFNPYLSYNSSGNYVYVLPVLTLNDTGYVNHVPYYYLVSKNGYVSQQGLTSLPQNYTVIGITLVPGFQPSILPPLNATTNIYSIMSEAGAGLGSFIEYLGAPVMTLLIILIMIAIVGTIAVAIAKRIDFEGGRY